MTAGLPGCGDAPGELRSVLLVTLDTTRADRLGCHGRPDVRTPVIDRVARGGVQFAQAIADVPVTLPSHTTLLTGIPALAHGVRYNADFRVGDRAETLAERLADRGYATGAVVSTLVLDRRFGLDQGFDTYDDELTPGYVKHDEALYPAATHWLPKADRRAPEAVARAAAWLAGAAPPFFCWTHFYDPHFPFDPPAPWGRTHADLYAAEIQFTDRELGRLLRAAAARDPDALVVVTADHGEGLDEHREDGHGIFVYDATIRVPLLIAGGGVPGGRLVAGQVRTADVASTVLALCGAGGTLGRGESLAGLVDDGGSGSRPAYSESIKSKLFYGGTGLKAIRTGDAKYVWAPRPELYDLVADPGETLNLVDADPERAAALRGRLEDVVRDLLASGRTVAEPTDLDPETAERLESLGYLTGGGGAAPGDADEELRLEGTDPKDLVDVSMAAREIQNGFAESGERKLLRFFRTARPPDDARMARLWAAAHLNYAKIWCDRRDWSRAAEEYGRAIAVDAEYAPPRWRRVWTLNLAGRADTAEREGAELLARYPKAWRVRLHRGLALALLGRTEDAERELRVAATAPESPPEVARSARWYLDRIGTDAEPGAVRAYLDG